MTDNAGVNGKEFADLISYNGTVDQDGIIEQQSNEKIAIKMDKKGIFQIQTITYQYHARKE